MLKFRARLLSNGFLPIPLYLLIEPQDTTGDLYADFSYALGYVREESIQRFHAFMLQFLKKGIAEPDKSLEQLISESMDS